MLTKTEAGHLKKLAEQASDRMGNAGCNDFPVPNTPANWRLYEEVGAANLGITVKEWRNHPDYEPRPEGDKLYFMDYALFDHLIRLAIQPHD